MRCRIDRLRKATRVPRHGAYDYVAKEAVGFWGRVHGSINLLSIESPVVH